MAGAADAIKPKLFKNEIKTVKHDLIHLWLHNPQHQQILINYVLQDLPLPQPTVYSDRSNHEYHEYLKPVRFKIVRKDTEMPLYGYNSFLLGIVDCVFEIKIVYQVRVKNSKDQMIKELDETNYVLCEFKPALGSISSVLGQVRVYKDKLSQRDNPPKPIYPVILTFNSNDTRFDDLLITEGIKVFRIVDSISL